MSALVEKYVHRQNEDGTYDSICPTCARTVGRGMSEARLATPETMHKCPGLPPSVIDRMAREYRMSQLWASSR
jgi:hypothetical protein